MKKKLIYYNWGILPYILIIFSWMAFLISTILFLKRISRVEIDGFKVLTTPIIILIFGIINQIFGLILSNIKRRQKKIDTWSPYSVASIDQEKQVITSNGLDEELSEGKNKESIDWNKINPLIIKQRNIDEKCPICKLPIEREDFIVKCPHCSHLFHGKHLIEWLLKHSNCPICRKKIDVR
ncbi:MAG: hypothetical protein JXA54_01425 [Candidatus Heimdallarchaeota archaeon]|nr:hypothetical protein [Candidatus Heimdallarchaeota archaeon]